MASPTPTGSGAGRGRRKVSPTRLAECSGAGTLCWTFRWGRRGSSRTAFLPDQLQVNQAFNSSVPVHGPGQCDATMAGVPCEYCIILANLPLIGSIAAAVLLRTIPDDRLYAQVRDDLHVVLDPDSADIVRERRNVHRPGGY
jgi:hypothetical protein